MKYICLQVLLTSTRYNFRHIIFTKERILTAFFLGVARVPKIVCVTFPNIAREKSSWFEFDININY